MKTKLNLLAAGIFLTAVNAGFGQSTLQLSGATYTVAESAGTVMLTVRRLNDTNTLVSVDFATADGTATNGLKYIATNGTLAFAAGQTNQSIVVTILNNGFVEGTKNFKVILSNPINAVLGTPTTNTVSITDNDVGLQFEFATYTVAEDAGAALLGVVRGDDGDLPVTVNLATTDLTATNGLDYTGIISTVSFAPTERLKFVPVPILNDSLKEAANKTFRVTLSNPVGTTLGSQKTTTVMIADNDQGFQFEWANCNVAENAGAALLRVLRGSDEHIPATVDYATSDGTATNGLKYTAVSGTLTFAAGETNHTIMVPLLNDGVVGGDKYFRVSLSNPINAVLGSPKVATVSITDTDKGLHFYVPTVVVNEDAGEVKIKVARGDDADTQVSVDYATTDGSAKAGQDYTTTAGTMVFGPGEVLKSIIVPIFSDPLAGPVKTFQVALSNTTSP